MISRCDQPVPYITTDQMREVDRLMIEVYHIELIQMMENAGRHLFMLARERFLGNDPRHRQVIVLAGTGGNGGGALVCARWLHNAGATVTVILTAAHDRFLPVPAHQLDTLLRMGVPVMQADALTPGMKPDVVIDGLIGYSLSGAPRGAAAHLIQWANASGSPILALDVPSGLDAASGTAFDPTIRAAATMTLALPKTGLRADAAKAVVGELYLANISVPPGLYAQPTLGLNAELIFYQSDILYLA
ncbi:MAG: NAD(P)H-hydrate epimerase [Anaerolineae bacterium]|nr:NAD(P)H-hydrate epimerase [Anaerolineae bacterium]